jgi:hypothetical protein
MGKLPPRYNPPIIRQSSRAAGIWMQQRKRRLGGSADPLAPPELVFAPAISGYPVVGITLTSSTGTWRSSSSITYTYQWQVAGLNVGTNQNTYVPVTGDIGKIVTCEVTATNTNGPTMAETAPTGNVTAAVAPTNTVAPVVHNVDGNTTSPVKVGTRLDIVNPGTWSGNPPQAAMTFTAQWQRNGVNISGANGEFYVTKFPEDVNQNITARLTASNGVAPPGQASSNFFSVYSLPVNTVPPVITGSGNDNNAAPGDVLQCNTGSWLGTGAQFSWAWRRDGTLPIGGSGNSYVVQAGDDPGTIDCVVTKTNEYGGTSVPSSNQYSIGIPFTITDITIAWNGLTGADVGYFTGEIVAGDYLDFQIDKVTTFDSVDLIETSDQLDANEVSSGNVEVVLQTLADDTWHIRVRARRGAQTSAWSAYDTYSAAASYAISTAGDNILVSPASNVITYTSRDFVDGDAIVVTTYGYNSRNVTGVMLDDVAMTKIHDVSNANPAEYATVWRLNGVTAGSYDVVVTWNATPGPVGFHSGTLVNGAASATDTAGREDTYTAGVITTSSPLTTPTDGVGLCVAWLGGSTTGNAAWANGTELDETVSEGWGISSAAFSAGTVTPEVDWAQSGGGSAVAISWGTA